MSYIPKTCRLCGANLDPTESCDCLEKADTATARARAKLQHILDREGDANGERRCPEYLEALIREEVLAAQAENYMSVERFRSLNRAVA